MANLRTNNLSGEQGQNAIRGAVNFGGYVNGSASDYLSVADHDDLDMGTGDFTFECWLLAVKHAGTNDPNFMGIFSSQSFTAGGFLIQVNNTGPLRLVIPLAAGGNFEESAGPSLFDELNHVAVVRTSGTIKGFVNGIEVISASHNVGVDFAHGGTCTIGENGYDQYPGDYPLRGTISNLRLTKGLARYTSTFTPPAFELRADADTVLLCCQNSDDPTQEETGKTITANGGLLQTASELTAGALTSSNYSSAGSDWSFSNGVATVSMSSSGYQSLGSVPSRLVNGQLYELVVNVTTFNAGKITFGQSNAGNADFTIALGRNVFRHVYSGSTQNTGGIAIYARDATGGGFAINFLSLKQVILGKQPKVIPPYGVDAGNAFGGPIQQSSQGYMYFPTGRTEERGRGRAIWGGGSASPNEQDVMDYLQITSSGNAIDFGNLSDSRNEVRACGSSTRGVWAGGRSPHPSVTDRIDFVEIPTTANAVDFGNLTVARAAVAAVSNSTRGCFMAGFAPSNSNHIDFITIASLGDATDFGDMLGTYQAQARAMSPTRGLAAGNYGASNLIEFITIATTGNSTDFGDRTVAAYSASGTSDNTRGVFTGGDGTPNTTNVIDFVTMASAGNATDFGDLVTANGSSHADTSNSIVGCIGGGASNTNAIEKIIIQTTGNAVDYGDLSVGRSQLGATSDSHGGLS